MAIPALTRRTFTRSLALGAAAAAISGAALQALAGKRLKVGHTGITWGFKPTDAEQAIKDVGSLGFAGYESFGNVLELVAMETDCDSDSLLVQARPMGPTCHLQRASCFELAPANFLSELDALVAGRERERPEGSYSTRLFEAGVRRIAQKVGEEGVETALAGVVQDDAALLGESADLLYHLLVLLRARGLGLADTVAVLEQRHRQA